MHTIAQSQMLLRTRAELPNGLRLATEEFREDWSFVRSANALRMEKQIIMHGWSFAKVADGLLRSGVGDTSPEAIGSALKLALRHIGPHFNAAEVEHIELTHYLVFFWPGSLFFRTAFSNLAQPANFPYPETQACGHQKYERAKQRSRPPLQASRPEMDDSASIGHPEPCNEGITQAASRAEDGEEAPARYPKRPRCQCERQKRNWWRKHGGKKDRQNGMMLNPNDNSAEKTRRHVMAQRRFSPFPANLPSGVSPEDAACNRTGSKQPGIAAVRHQPQQEQVGTAGKRKRDNRGIHDRNGEKAERS